jgi:hypothetical protein
VQCDEEFAQGYCNYSCRRCPKENKKAAIAAAAAACTDTLPDWSPVNCQEQKGFGKVRLLLLLLTSRYYHSFGMLRCFYHYSYHLACFNVAVVPDNSILLLLLLLLFMGQVINCSECHVFI